MKTNGLNRHGFPAFSHLLLLLLLQIPSASPSMLFQTAGGQALDLFPSSIPSVKAFSAIGPNYPYELAFSTLDHPNHSAAPLHGAAPLLYLDPSDSSTCPRCCSSFSPSTTLPLSPPVVSLVANRTVVISAEAAQSCSPVVNQISGFETMHVALGSAGARAVIIVETGVIPGVSSNVVGSFSSPSDRRLAKSSLVPFVAIGSETGEELIAELKYREKTAAAEQKGADPIHAVFKYDPNAFIAFYQTFIEVPFKFLSFLTFALIVLRCHSLGLHFHPSSKLLGLPLPPLPLLTSTRNLVVLMVIPVAAAIMCSVSLNGLAQLGEESKGWVTYSAGIMFPSLNLSSSVIVARFWSSRQASLTEEPPGHASESYHGFASDPAKTQPVRTLLIVFIGLFLDVAAFFTFFVFSDYFQSGRLVFSILALLLALGNISATAYFFHSGIKVLRSLAARSLSSSNKPLKAMAIYLILVAGFTLMIIASFVLAGSRAYLASVEGNFLYLMLFCIGNYGTSLCHLFVFTADKDGDRSHRSGGGGGGGGGGDGDETFLETEYRVLTERSRVQDEDIERLTKENGLIKEAAELEYRLLETSLLQAETNGKLLKAEKESMKQNAKDSLLFALREIRQPLNAVVLGVKHILKHVLTATLDGPKLTQELKHVQVNAHHLEVLVASAVHLDTFIAGNKPFETFAFSPARLCREAVKLQALTAREGVEIVLVSTLKDEVFMGTPPQLSLVLSNLLSSAAMSTEAGTVELKATVVKDASKYQIINFAVRDNGQEVPASEKAVFFGARGQLGNESEQISTFGFGIFVAHEFVKRMRGALLLASPAFDAKERGGSERHHAGWRSYGGRGFCFEVSVLKLESTDVGGSPELKGRLVALENALAERQKKVKKRGQKRRDTRRCEIEGVEGVEGGEGGEGDEGGEVSFEVSFEGSEGSERSEDEGEALRPPGSLN